MIVFVAIFRMQCTDHQAHLPCTKVTIPTEDNDFSHMLPSTSVSRKITFPTKHTKMLPPLGEPPIMEERAHVEINVKHGHVEIVQAVAYNRYGDRCATGSTDGKIRIFNRHQDGIWRIYDAWNGHQGEILEVNFLSTCCSAPTFSDSSAHTPSQLQWLPPTVYPNVVASLGMEGRFKLWPETPNLAPGRRFGLDRHRGGGGSSSSSDNAKPAFDTGSPRAPYRSFSLRHNEESRQTHLALLSEDGTLTVHENDLAENLASWTQLDELRVCEKPARGAETSFRVRFDPNPDPCYTALRAGVPTDALGLVVAAMDTVKVYRTRDVVFHAYGVPSTKREFYEAASGTGHRSLVRDVAWAPGNIRGYDIVASACMDGYVRVLRLDAPYDPADGKSWSKSDLVKGSTNADGSSKNGKSGRRQAQQHPGGISQGVHHPASDGDRRKNQAGQVTHHLSLISSLEHYRQPMWRVGFDDDGQILGCVGDDGKLLCFRQYANGQWGKSSQIATAKMKMPALQPPAPPPPQNIAAPKQTGLGD